MMIVYIRVLGYSIEADGMRISLNVCLLEVNDAKSARAGRCVVVGDGDKSSKLTKD